MAWKKGQPGGPGRNKKTASACVFDALVKAKCEPVNRLIKIAETSANEETKISIWKYLIEMREGSIEKLAASGARSSNDADLLKQLEAPAPEPKVPKTAADPAQPAQPAS